LEKLDGDLQGNAAAAKKGEYIMEFS